MSAEPLQKTGLDGLPDHFWHVQVRRADDGAHIFTGFVTAKSMAAAFREAARHWPGCGIRIKALGSAGRRAAERLAASQPGPSIASSFPRSAR